MIDKIKRRFAKVYMNDSLFERRFFRFFLRKERSLIRI